MFGSLTGVQSVGMSNDYNDEWFDSKEQEEDYWQPHQYWQSIRVGQPDDDGELYLLQLK